jgi:CubicO group peptidase (beta-lactamase class C family)
MYPLTALAFVLAAPLVLKAQDTSTPQNPTAPYADQFREWTDGSRAVALAAAVRDGASSAVIAVGHFEEGGDREVEVGSLFEIGSITKGFTGILLADMVLRGEVNLDDPVANHLPAAWDLPDDNDTPITLLDLATHTSGLPRLHDGFLPADLERPYEGTDLSTLADAVRATGLSRPAAVGYAYSNFGMALLGQALAHRAGIPYAALLRERVLSPLGMDDTFVGAEPAAMGRMVTGHQYQLLPVAHWAFGSYEPAGAVVTSAPEMMPLIDALLTPPDSPVGLAVALATTPVRSLGVGRDSIGLAWHLHHEGGHRIIWHNGGTGGFRSWMGVDREAGRGVVLLNNVAFAWTDPVGMKMLLEMPMPTLPAARAIQPRTLSASERGEYLGRYAISDSVTLTVAEAAGHLTAQIPGQPPFRLVADDRDHFVVVIVAAVLHFERNAEGAIEAAVLIQGGREQRGTREP